MNLKSNYLVNQQGNKPVAPLPNPGEGGPVNGEMDENTPVIPLPNPGEGGPVYNPPMENRPTIPLPNPGEGGPVFPSYPGSNRPGGNVLPTIIGTIITTHPRPNAPCRFCNPGSNKYGNVRFMNTASDYNPFTVYVNENIFVSNLNFAEVTDYEKVASGFQTISVTSSDGYIYIQKPVMIPQNGTITIAIITTETGLDLMVIPDVPCNNPINRSCIRVGNLSFNSGPLSVIIGEQYLSFENVKYKEITDYSGIWPGKYDYYITKSNSPMRPSIGSTSVLLSSTISVQVNSSYTMYLFNWNKSSPDAIQVLIIEEK